MANLKNITDVPVVESAEGLNLIVNDNGAAKQIAASAVGAQADWSVIDASSPAFIKNKPVIPEGFSGSWNDLKDKPFGEGEEIIVLEHATYDGFFNPEADFNVLENLPQIDVTIGDNVNVFWDGEVYNCAVYKKGNVLFFGNPCIHGENDNGIPFTFELYSGSNWYVAAYGDTSITSHTFGITKVCVHKLDAKYLPPTYDFVIVANNDYTAKLVVGDYNTIYNKLINGEFVDGKVIVYYWTGEDETTNHFYVSRIHTRLEISLGNIDDVACINFLLMDDDGHYCTIKNDNTVYYWSVD